MLIYADTSALAKLVVDEPESVALRAWCEARAARLITCALTRTELVRAVRRQNPHDTVAATRLLGEVAIINLDQSVYDEAAILPPPELRSLDAIHLAAARLLGSQLDGILSYDARLAEAAESIGIPAFSPA